MTRIINLISGPRNISTALMYSFAQRSDTRVIDEPFYAHYLIESGIDYHPGQDEVLASMPSDVDVIKRDLIYCEIDRPLYFIKGMAHHLLGVDWHLLLDFENLFLIRNPYQLIASFAAVIDHPTMLDIGLKLEWEIFQFLLDRGHRPVVIDSNDILKDPKRGLTAMCTRMNIPMDKDMLQWTPGPRPEDGVWAQYWYKNVWQSSGFKKQETSSRLLPDHLLPLYNEAKIYFDKLKEYT
jgi:hypothetical protein